MKKSIIILSLILVIPLGFYLDNLYRTWQTQNNAMVEQQASAISALQSQIKALQDKPEPTPVAPQVIYKTNIVEKVVMSETPKEKTTAEIIAEWQNRIAEVTCEWRYNTGVVYKVASGSATLVDFTDSGISALTNKHVLLDEDRYTPTRCLINVWGIGYRELTDTKGQLYNDKTRDFGWATLGTASQTPQGVFENVGGFTHCSNVNIGDKIVILGYPYIGTNQGITATAGMISGIEQDYYVTDAKIEHGNSGGAAILIKDDCWIGIPSASITGTTESMGRILRADVVWEN